MRLEVQISLAEEPLIHSLAGLSVSAGRAKTLKSIGAGQKQAGLQYNCTSS